MVYIFSKSGRLLPATLLKPTPQRFLAGKFPKSF